jgi:hypothetical protein
VLGTCSSSFVAEVAVVGAEDRALPRNGDGAYGVVGVIEGSCEGGVTVRPSSALDRLEGEWVPLLALSVVRKP